MKVEEMRTKIDSVLEVIRSEVPNASPEEAKFVVLIVAGVELLGELLIDIKRIADATEAL